MTAIREVLSAADLAWVERLHAPHCRVLPSDAETVAASHFARAEYVALFQAHFGLTPPDEWLSRWWPHG